MKKIFLALTAVVLAIGLSSCNQEIENPRANNFVGTWDLKTIETTVLGSTVVSKPDHKTSLVITKETITSWTNDSKDWEGTFSFDNDRIFVNGTATYDVEFISYKEMTLTQSAFGLAEAKYNYKRR